MVLPIGSDQPEEDEHFVDFCPLDCRKFVYPYHSLSVKHLKHFFLQLHSGPVVLAVTAFPVDGDMYSLFHTLLHLATAHF